MQGKVQVFLQVRPLLIQLQHLWAVLRSLLPLLQVPGPPALCGGVGQCSHGVQGVLPTGVFDSFMYCPYMFREITLLRKFFATLPTVKFDPFTIGHSRCFIFVKLLMSK